MGVSMGHVCECPLPQSLAQESQHTSDIVVECGLAPLLAAFNFHWQVVKLTLGPRFKNSLDPSRR